jgi:hypothetical protein
MHAMQVLRVAQQDAAVTIFFHPNRAGGAEQRPASAGAASFTCGFSSAQVGQPCCVYARQLPGKGHTGCHISSQISSEIFCTASVAQEAERFVASLEGSLERYARAMLHVSRGYSLQETCQVLAVSHGPACAPGGDPWRQRGGSSRAADEHAESVVARSPEWGHAIDAPATWRLDGDQVRPDCCSETTAAQHTPSLHTPDCAISGLCTLTMVA